MILVEDAKKYDQSCLKIRSDNTSVESEFNDTETDSISLFPWWGDSALGWKKWRG